MTTAYIITVLLMKRSIPMATTCNHCHVNEKYPMTTTYMITVLLMKRSIPIATTYIYCHVNEKCTFPKFTLTVRSFNFDER